METRDYQTKKKRSKLVFDIEANGLLEDNLTTVWVGVTYDLDTEEVNAYSDYDPDLPNFNEFLVALKNARLVIGHNIIAYDLVVLKRIYNFELSESTSVIDTLLMSQVLNFRRFGFGHSLAKWGEFFNCPKVIHEDWSQYSKAMLNRCKVDVVDINVKVYKKLKSEFKIVENKYPAIKYGLRSEHAADEFVARAFERGWKINKEKALILKKKLEASMRASEEKIEPLMQGRIKAKDKEPQQPKFTKAGKYHAHIIRWFDLPENSGVNNRIIDGPYIRIEYIPPDLGSPEFVKRYLYSIGWEPLDWNFKKDGKRRIKTSPKLCEASLSKLGEVGIEIDRYYTTRSRLSILNTWLENLDSNDRLHGDAFVIGTPTFRMRHKSIVNIPSAELKDDGTPEKLWGPDIREIFCAEEGYKIVGGDSSGNQLRAFCYYLNNEEYTNEVINGDAHQKHANILKVSRSVAKPFLYAFLFGAAGDKLALILKGVRDRQFGEEKKELFIKKIEGLEILTKRVNRIYNKTKAKTKGKPYLIGLDGRRVYCDSLHKALNYLLQSFEAITCKGALLYAMEEIKKRNLEAYPLIMYHDEIQLEVKEEHAEEVAKILEEALRDSSKYYFNVFILDGKAKIGDNWAETH